jgi:hypothetical protein
LTIATELQSQIKSGRSREEEEEEQPSKIRGSTFKKKAAE